jgi:hypothetical protein
MRDGTIISLKVYSKTTNALYNPYFPTLALTAVKLSYPLTGGFGLTAYLGDI